MEKPSKLQMASNKVGGFLPLFTNSGDSNAPASDAAVRIGMLLASFSVVMLAISLNIALIIGLATLWKKSKIGNRNVLLYIGFLALSDVIMSLANTTFMTVTAISENKWFLGDIVCKLREPLATASSGVSCWLMALIAFERYRRIVLHKDNTTFQSSFETSTLRKLHSIWPAIFLIICNAALTVPAVLHFQVASLNFPLVVSKVNSLQVKEFTLASYCVQVWAQPEHFITYVALQFLLLFVAPLTISFVIYIKLILFLKNRAAAFAASRRYATKSIAILLLILVLFILCWGPYQTLYLVANVLNSGIIVKQDVLAQVPVYLFHSLRLMSMLSAIFNPILYGFYMFRRSFSGSASSTNSNARRSNFNIVVQTSIK